MSIPLKKNGKNKFSISSFVKIFKPFIQILSFLEKIDWNLKHAMGRQDMPYGGASYIFWGAAINRDQFVEKTMASYMKVSIMVCLKEG